MLFCALGEHKFIIFLVCSGFHYCNLQLLHVTVSTLLTSLAKCQLYLFSASVYPHGKKVAQSRETGRNS